MTCTGAVESAAATVDEIIREVAAARVTERSGRADDQRAETAMEDRKRAGILLSSGGLMDWWTGGLGTAHWSQMTRI